MAIKLIYGDLPLGAAEDAEVTTADHKSFSDPAMLPVGVSSGAIATLEQNCWGLSPEIKTRGSQQIAFWSEHPSVYNCYFPTPPKIEISFDGQYAASGLTFRFSPENNEYCNHIYVEWWQNGEIKESGEFFPTSPNYVAEKAVEAFDKVVVQFLATNFPFRRVKLEALIIGVIREIGKKELLSAQYINEIDLLSTSIPINVVDAEFITEAKTDLIFQKRQPVEVYNDSEFVGVYYVESGSRIGERRYSISCQDAIGILDSGTYSGGFWLEEVSAVEILNEIVDGIFELDIDENLLSSTVKGYMPELTKRAALQYVAFALGAIVDTSGSTKIKIFLPPAGDGLAIPPAETYTGGKLSTSDIVTKVIVRGYDIQNKEPTEPWDTSITINKKQYEYYSRNGVAINPNVPEGTLPNVIEFADNYLISDRNMAQARADAILAYYMRRNSYNVSHVSKGEKPSARVNISLPWGGAQNGSIIKMQVVSTGITVSNSDILLD